MVINRQRILHILMLLGIALFAAPSYAASLVATVSSNKVTKAEVFQLRLTYDEKVDSNSIEFSALEPDFFMGQPSFATSLNYINGKRSSRSEWTIALKAKSLGQATIPAFTIDGVSSQPIKIQVSQDTDLPKASELVDIQNQLAKHTLYPNETTRLNTRLVIKADPRRLQNVKITPPQGIGFNVVQVGEPNQYTTLINGLEATVVDQTFDITVQDAQATQLQSIGFDATVVFGSNRSGTTKLLPVQIKPEILKIDVRKQPENVQGTWLPTANLKLEQRWLNAQNQRIAPQNEAVNIELGDSLTRNLTLTIQGLKPEFFPSLSIDYPDFVRQYAEKPQFKTLNDGSVEMTIQQVLIAQKVGKTTLPAMKIHWFDTQTETTKEATVSGLSIDITANQSSLSNAIVAPTTPTAPPVTATISSGYWPYLTALFALLWLATLALYIRLKWYSRSPTPIEAKSNPELNALIKAIHDNDVVQSQLLAKQWLSTKKAHNPQVAAEIEQELQAMAAHQYGSDTVHNTVTWQNKKLLTLIKQLSHCDRSEQKNRQLAKL